MGYVSKFFYSGVHSDEVQKVFDSSNDYRMLVKLKLVKIVNVFLRLATWMA